MAFESNTSPGESMGVLLDDVRQFVPSGDVNIFKDNEPASDADIEQAVVRVHQLVALSVKKSLFSDWGHEALEESRVRWTQLEWWRNILSNNGVEPHQPQTTFMRTVLETLRSDITTACDGTEFSGSAELEIAQLLYPEEGDANPQAMIVTAPDGEPLAVGRAGGAHVYSVRPHSANARNVPDKSILMSTFDSGRLPSVYSDEPALRIPLDGPYLRLDWSRIGNFALPGPLRYAVSRAASATESPELTNYIGVASSATHADIANRVIRLAAKAPYVPNAA